MGADDETAALTADGDANANNPQGTGAEQPSPPKEDKSKSKPATEYKFMPYRSYIGPLDGFLGISMFWTEKLLILVMYLQRYVLLLLWPQLNWPASFYKNISFMYAFLLDFTAKRNPAPALGAGSIFEGCDTICKVVWPLFCLPILIFWAIFTIHKSLPLYYTRNVERILWGVVRIGLLPFMNTLIRYFILNSNGDVDALTPKWVTPISETGVVLALFTWGVFLIVAYSRSYRLVLFQSSIRHEAWIRARELEYKLRFSAVYRNDRVWMISSYTRSAWWWSFARGFFDVVLLLILAFVPPRIGIIIGCCILGLNWLFGFLFVNIHRCWSSNVMEHFLNFVLFVFSIFGALRCYNVRNPLLVDSDLDYFLWGIHASGVGIVLLLGIYFFIDSHKFGSGSIADRRARAKWHKEFGAQGAEANKLGRSGTWVQMPLARSKSEIMEEEAERQQRGSTATNDKRFAAMEAMVDEEGSTGGFYLPKEATFFSLNCASPHVWPVNGVVINELLRRNQEDHLIDYLRAARKMLDRISALHNTAMLIPTDEMKTHINRLKDCITSLQRTRITHHINAIHPLHGTLEDLIEQFSFELRVFSGRSITVGHNARKMITVSRYLRKRMLIRDHALALVSPLMRRVLIKLLALRMWIQLLEDRHSLLPRRDSSAFDAFKKEIEGDEGSSDDEEPQVGLGGKRMSLVQNVDVFALGSGSDLNINVPFADFNDGETFEFAEQLAKAVEHRHEDASHGTESAENSTSLTRRASKVRGGSLATGRMSMDADANLNQSASLSLSKSHRKREVGFADDVKDLADKKAD